MNCQEISSLLDDRDIAALSDAERRAVDAHLPACAECAHEWAVHQRLSAMAIPPLPATLAAQCRVLVAMQSKVGADTQGRRGVGSRLILIGTVAAVAAAAAVLAIRLHSPAETQPATAAIAAPSPAPVAMAVATPSAVAAPVARARAQVEPKKKPEPLLESPRFTVRVLPLQDRTTDEPSRQAVKSFYASLLDGLRAVPGLTLIESDAASSEIALGEFLLTVKGDGPLQGKWSAEMLLVTDVPVSGDPKGAHARVPYRLAYGDVLAPSCAGSPTDLPTPNCSNPARGAAGMIELMRQVAFPPDPNARRVLQTRLLDRTLDASERWKAFDNLRSERAVVRAGARAPMLSGERPAIDAETLHGALDLVATTDDPFIRTQIWRALRGVRQPELVQPLIDSLRLEANENTRLAALTTLAADYAQDAGARTVLEYTAINDSRELVRMIAQRGLSGEAVWNEYAVARLQDVGLPDAQRMEALAYMAASGQGQQLRVLLDAKAVEALAQIMPRALAALPDSSAPRGPNTDGLLSLAGNLTNTNQPATIDLLVGMLKVGGDPTIRRMAVFGLASHRDDKRARAILDEIGADDPDVKLREAALSNQPQLITPPPGT